MAFEVATRLCRQGRLTVLHVDEEKSASLQLPVISSDFILEGTMLTSLILSVALQLREREA